MPGSKNIVAGANPVVYAGRFSERVAKAGMPPDCQLLSDWEVLPAQLNLALRRATDLIILDPLSFPFESMTDEQRDVPVTLAIPIGSEPYTLDEVLGGPLLSNLGFFDRIVTGDDALWNELGQKYRWRPSQRIRLDAAPETVADEISIEEGDAGGADVTGDVYEPLSYWTKRGRALAQQAPLQAICGSRPDLSLTKAMHRVQSAALEHRFVAAKGSRDADASFDVLEVGAGVGRWASVSSLCATRYHGVDVSEDMLGAALRDYPEARFEHLGTDLLLPYHDESFDLAFTVDTLHHNPTPSKRTLLSEMWRVTRPGGRLLFLEDFVAERMRPGSTIYPMSIKKFASLVMQASVGRVTLEHAQSLRYPGDDISRAGLLELSRLGTPKSW